jgi:GTP cyclohydrolase I
MDAKKELPDVQKSGDDRGVALDNVGVRDMRYPISVLEQGGGKQQTVADVSMSVGLPKDFRGTHMSRFVEVLNSHQGEFTMRTLPDILSTVRERLEAQTARIKLEFPYFLERKAPVSEKKALMDYQCRFLGKVGPEGDDFVLGVEVPVTSLCPCSKEISDHGAHNQRGVIDVEVRGGHSDPADFIWIEEIVDWAEESASAPLYPLLKREDERHVTMQAYENPAFVEDITREMALRLKEEERVRWFHLEVENFESIHNHNAFAETEWGRNG